MATSKKKDTSGWHFDVPQAKAQGKRIRDYAAAVGSARESFSGVRGQLAGCWSDATGKAMLEDFDRRIKVLKEISEALDVYGAGQDEIVEIYRTNTLKII